MDFFPSSPNRVRNTFQLEALVKQHFPSLRLRFVEKSGGLADPSVTYTVCVEDCSVYAPYQLGVVDTLSTFPYNNETQYEFSFTLERDSQELVWRAIKDHLDLIERRSNEIDDLCSAGWADASCQEPPHEKGRQLLQSVLTPEQWEEFENQNTIRVQGGETGTWYRLTWKRNINIMVEGGSRRGCVVPAKNVPMEDQLLAQLLLIETREADFLQLVIWW